MNVTISNPGPTPPADVFIAQLNYVRTVLLATEGIMLAQTKTEIVYVCRIREQNRAEFPLVSFLEIKLRPSRLIPPN